MCLPRIAAENAYEKRQEILVEINDVQEKNFDDEENENVDGKLITKPRIEEARKHSQFLKIQPIFTI